MRNHGNCSFSGEFLYAIHDENLVTNSQASVMGWPSCYVSMLHFLVETGRTNSVCGMVHSWSGIKSDGAHTKTRTLLWNATT